MRVLLTGASGVVGVAVAERLRAAGDRVIALTHRTQEFIGNDGRTVEIDECVHGDVRRPEFGAAIGAVDLVVHCAATTDFGAPDQVYEELNVTGTANAVAFARERGVPLVHVSTAYVSGLRNGRVAEADLDSGQDFGNGYEHSKFRAEQLIHAAGVPAAIVRPSIVVGRSIDGAIRDYKNMYPVVKLIAEGKLASLPGRYDATLSLVPVDHVADVIAAAVSNIDSSVGTTFHAVGADVVSLRDVSDVLAEYPSFRVARFVPAATFSVDDLDPIEREYYTRIGSLYTSYFGRRVEFDATNTTERLGLPSPESGTDFLRLLLDSCLETGYLGRPLASIGDVLARLGTR